MDTTVISPSIRRLAAISLWASGTAILASCKDTSAPIETPPIQAILSAASPTSISAVVATELTTIPTVFVHDANGRPLPDIVVVFRLTISDGSLYTPIARSNAAGLASPSGWKLGTKAGEQIVIATVGSQSVIFRAIAAAGPPVTFSKFAGDDQQAPGGTAVLIPPQVQLLDAYTNPVSGIAVGFEVDAGGGALTGERTTTNSEGIATLGSWTLGLTAEQRVIASSGTLTPVTFSAIALTPESPCVSGRLLQNAIAQKSALGDPACQAVDGHFVDTYTVTVPQEGFWHFKLTSSEFDSRLELRDEKGIPIAGNRADSSTTNSEVRALLPAGRIRVVITSVAAGATGAYEISYAKAFGGVDGCEISIARGVSTGRNVNGPSACPLLDNLPADRFRIYMTARSFLSLRLDDFSLSANRFELQDDEGRTQAVGVLKNYVESTLEFTAGASGYYVILVQVAEEYSLTVR